MNYIVFAGENYYPSGGASDIVDTFHALTDEKLQDLKKMSLFSMHDWIEVYCIRTKTVIYRKDDLRALAVKDEDNQPSLLRHLRH